MLVSALIKIEGRESHIEDIEIKNGDDPKQAWIHIIERFNANLKLGEKPREFIKVSFLTNIC